MSREVCGICWCPYDEFTGECACVPEPSAQGATMNREDIERMARAAKGHAYTNRYTPGETAFAFSIDRLEHFAALVYERGFVAGMKNEEQITIEAVAAERQKCADIADAHASIEGIAQKIAAEIRGQQ